MSDDNDDQIHENALLASAYLDGEITSDERALVETSPETLAEVEALTQVSTVLSATAPEPTLSEREAHLAGALDVWERMSDVERSGEATPATGVDAAAAAAVSTPVSSSDGRRWRGARTDRRRTGSFGASQWVFAAAAALVVVVGVAAIARGFIADDTATNDAAPEQNADDELSELETEEAAEVAGENVGGDFAPSATDLSDDVATNPEAAADDTGLFPADAESDAMTNEATEESQESADAPSAGAGDAAEQPAPAPEDNRVELSTPDDLAAYGSLVIQSIQSGPRLSVDIDREPPFNSCEADFGIEEMLEPAFYRGEEVGVGVDLDEDIVYAYTEDCRLVESVPLPTPQSEP